MQAFVSPQERSEDLSRVLTGMKIDEEKRRDVAEVVFRALRAVSDKYRDSSGSTRGQMTTVQELVFRRLLDYFVRQLRGGSLCGLESRPPFELIPPSLKIVTPPEPARPPSRCSLVLSLPIELLSYIFELLHSRDTCEDSSRLSHIPTTMSHVSRRFRDVALSCQKLWTHITVTHVRPTHRTITFLQRADTCLLDVELSLSVVPFQEVDIKQLMDPLLPPSRWKSFTIISDPETMRACLRLCRSAAFNVRSLVLVNSCPERILYDAVDPLQLFDISHADSITIVGVPISWGELALTELKRLTVQWQPIRFKPTIETWSVFLRSLYMLESLVIKGAGPYFHSDSVASYTYRLANTVVLGSLKTLRLSNLNSGSFLFLSRTIRAPALRSLELSDVTGLSAWSDMETFWIERYRSLQVLDIRRTDADLEELLIILRTSVDVEELRLFGPDCYLQAFIEFDDEAPPLFPKLRRLVMEEHDEEHLLAFIESRERLGLEVGEIVRDVLTEGCAFTALSDWIVEVDRVN